MNKKLDFKARPYSNVDFQAMGEKLVAGLILLGYPEDTAMYMVEQFQNASFNDGHAVGRIDAEYGEDA